MAKLKNPLFSLKATGGLTKLFSLAKRQGRHIIERKPRPADAQSPAQLFYRNMFSMCKDLWHTLSDAEKQEWESSARPKHMTGYAWYISQCLRPNPGIYLPLIGGKMSGDIDMDGNKIEDLPDPAAAQAPATKAYHDANKYTNAQADARIALHAAIAAAHHARYTNGEADARIALHAAIAAAHHARYTDAEVTTIADALIAVHAALVTGVHGAGDSVLATTANIATHAAIAAAHHAAFVLGDHTAIGNNAPHHAKYTNAEADARIAIHALIAAAHHAAFILGDHTAIGNNAPHHAKYTNGEATAAAKTVKLDDFATPDDNTDLNASAARHGLFKKLSGVATEFLNGLGNWATPAGDVPTKEFFVPVTQGNEITWQGYYPVARLNASCEWGRVAFRVPHDFNSIITAEFVVIAKATQAAANWDIIAQYAAIGEAYNTHAEVDGATTYNVTNLKIEAVDISGILTALAANDYVGVSLHQVTAGHNLDILGVHFKYS